MYIENGPKREIEAIQQISSGVHKGVKLIPLCTIAGLFCDLLEWLSCYRRTVGFKLTTNKQTKKKQKELTKQKKIE